MKQVSSSVADGTATACAEGVHALVDWAVGTSASAIPAEVLTRAAAVLADDIAAMIGARDEPEVRAFQQRTLLRASVAQATIFRGGCHRTDRLSAAVANAVAGNWLELDEGYRPLPCHAGLYVVPALIAEAESRSLTVREVLRCAALAYEIVTRVARTWPPKVFNVHSHARYSAVGASVATSLASGLDAGIMHAALTGAATLVNAGPRNHLLSGALIRNVWPALGAWSGMMSVEWAQCGIAGAETGLDDVYASVFGSDAQPGELTRELGRRWAVQDGYTKIFACCQHLHSAVEAALEIRDDVMAGGGTDAITAIAVDTHPLAQALANASPTTTLGAKFSLPHAVAATLVTATGGAEAFASATLADAAIARLRQRVSIHSYEMLPPPPNDRPARVRVTLASGRTLEGECLSARGGSDRPFAPDVFTDKLRALTAGAYPNFVAVFTELLQLDAARLAQTWPAFVGDLCADR